VLGDGDVVVSFLIRGGEVSSSGEIGIDDVNVLELHIKLSFISKNLHESKIF
jgi:hypothetical protein